MALGAGEKCRGIFGRLSGFRSRGRSASTALPFWRWRWPWLSGTVEIPYDAASQFYPQLAFLARSLATGQSPFWTPNIFAGWPQIADPQSLIFSPLHVIAALLVPNPSPWLADVLVFALLYAGGAGMILFFRDRGWHVGGALVAALAFAFGGSAASRIQHIGQVESLVFLPLALWLLARALERSSWRAGAGAGVFAALIVLGRDQVALHRGLCARRLCALALAERAGLAVADRREHEAADRGRHRRGCHRRGAGDADRTAGAPFEPAGHRLCLRRRRLAASGQSADAGVRRSVRRIRFQPRVLGAAGLCLARRVRADRSPVAQNMGQIYVGALVAVAVLGFGVVRGLLWSREIRFFTVAMAADAALCARQVHAGVPCDVRLDAGREAVPPAGRCDLRVRRAARDARAAISCIAG